MITIYETKSLGRWITLHRERPALSGNERLLASLRAGVDVAAVDGAAVDYFVSAGALFGRFVHACGLVSRALDVPRDSSGRSHNLFAGHAACDGGESDGDEIAHGGTLNPRGGARQLAQMRSCVNR